MSESSEKTSKVSPDNLYFETDDEGIYTRLKPHLKQQIEHDAPFSIMHRRVELFHESVLQTMVDRWCNTKPLCTNLVRGYPFVGIWVAMNQAPLFGFFNKSRQDETKGKIIECINSGRILTLITPGLLQKEILVFCPTASTLESMLEFPLLLGIKYQICFVSPTGFVWLTDIDISYKAAANLILQDLYVQNILISALEGYIAGSSDVDEPGEQQRKL